MLIKDKTPALCRVSDVKWKVIYGILDSCCMNPIRKKKPVLEELRVRTIELQSTSFTIIFALDWTDRRIGRRTDAQKKQSIRFLGGWNSVDVQIDSDVLKTWTEQKRPRHSFFSGPPDITRRNTDAETTGCGDALPSAVGGTVPFCGRVSIRGVAHYASPRVPPCRSILHRLPSSSSSSSYVISALREWRRTQPPKRTATEASRRRKTTSSTKTPTITTTRRRRCGLRSLPSWTKRAASFGIRRRSRSSEERGTAGVCRYRQIHRHLSGARKSLSGDVRSKKNNRWLKWGGPGGFSPIWAPCNSMSPLIESIKCYFMPK